MTEWRVWGWASGWLSVVALLWAVGAVAVAAGALVDWRGRASAPETPLRTYLAAVTNEDLAAALAEILPTEQAAAAAFVTEQLGNEYRVLGVGVRQPSPLARLVGSDAAERALITVQLDVTLTTGETWRTTTHVAAVRAPEGWYLEHPPLQPRPAA